MISVTFKAAGEGVAAMPSNKVIKQVPSETGGMKASPLKAMLIRMCAAIVMAAVVVLIISMGHHALSCFVFICEGAVFRELLNVRYKVAKEREIPWFRMVHWSLFLVGTFYLHGGKCPNFFYIRVLLTR